MPRFCVSEKMSSAFNSATFKVRGIAPPLLKVETVIKKNRVHECLIFQRR